MKPKTAKQQYPMETWHIFLSNFFLKLHALTKSEPNITTKCLT